MKESDIQNPAMTAPSHITLALADYDMLRDELRRLVKENEMLKRQAERLSMIELNLERTIDRLNQDIAASDRCQLVFSTVRLIDLLESLKKRI